MLLREVVHELGEVEQEAAPSDTTDADDLMESEFFDTRQNFLSLCQGNHYQYDTLRRAKHSSMMVLYHLHNPTAPGFVSTCNVCHKDIDKGVQWRCNTCDFDMCEACRSMQPNAHPHPLSQVSSAPSTAQNVEARQQRVDQVGGKRGRGKIWGKIYFLIIILFFTPFLNIFPLSRPPAFGRTAVGCQEKRICFNLIYFESISCTINWGFPNVVRVLGFGYWVLGSDARHASPPPARLSLHPHQLRLPQVPLPPPHLCARVQL